MNKNTRIFIAARHAAVDYARENAGAVLCKYADPTDDAREGLSIEEADEICKVHPSLIYALSASTTTAVTTSQITALRGEAYEHGDHDMALICELALAPHETANADGADLIGPDGKVWTRSQAREACAEVIAEAQAQ